MMMHYLIEGFILAIQFFTPVPIRKEVRWEARRARVAIILLPLLGLMFGSGMAFILLALDGIDLSTLALSVILLFLTVAVTGGLHLDGWMDCADAYFSYQDKERRLEIMSDPRTGAFGVFAVIFLLLFRWLFLYETLTVSFSTSLLMLMVIPVLSRIGMVYLLVFTRSAKQKGLAHHFQHHLLAKDFYLSGAVGILLILMLFHFFSASLTAVMLVVLVLVLAIVWKKLIQRAFGGVTGDTLGAFIEGGETFLWMTVWSLLSFVMG